MALQVSDDWAMLEGRSALIFRLKLINSIWNVLVLIQFVTWTKLGLVKSKDKYMPFTDLEGIR